MQNENGENEKRSYNIVQKTTNGTKQKTFKHRWKVRSRTEETETRTDEEISIFYCNDFKLHEKDYSVVKSHFNLSEKKIIIRESNDNFEAEAM